MLNITDISFHANVPLSKKILYFPQLWVIQNLVEKQGDALDIVEFYAALFELEKLIDMPGKIITFSCYATNWYVLCNRDDFIIQTLLRHYLQKNTGDYPNTVDEVRGVLSIYNSIYPDSIWQKNRDWIDAHDISFILHHSKNSNDFLHKLVIGLAIKHQSGGI